MVVKKSFLLDHYPTGVLKLSQMPKTLGAESGPLGEFLLIATMSQLVQGSRAHKKREF